MHPRSWDFLWQPATGADSEEGKKPSDGGCRGRGARVPVVGVGHLWVGSTPSHILCKLSFLFNKLLPPHSQWETRLKEEPEVVKWKRAELGFVSGSGSPQHLCSFLYNRASKLESGAGSDPNTNAATAMRVTFMPDHADHVLGSLSIYLTYLVTAVL